MHVDHETLASHGLRLSRNGPSVLHSSSSTPPHVSHREQVHAFLRDRSIGFACNPKMIASPANRLAPNACLCYFVSRAEGRVLESRWRHKNGFEGIEGQKSELRCLLTIRYLLSSLDLQVGMRNHSRVKIASLAARHALMMLGDQTEVATDWSSHVNMWRRDSVEKDE